MRTICASMLFFIVKGGSFSTNLFNDKTLTKIDILRPGFPYPFGTVGIQTGPPL